MVPIPAVRPEVAATQFPAGCRRLVAMHLVAFRLAERWLDPKIQVATRSDAKDWGGMPHAVEKVAKQAGSSREIGRRKTAIRRRDTPLPPLPHHRHHRLGRPHRRLGRRHGRTDRHTLPDM